MCICCSATRRLWLPATRGSVVLQRALGAATLLVATSMLLWSAARLRTVQVAFKSSDLPLAGLHDHSQPFPSKMTETSPSKQGIPGPSLRERLYPSATPLQLVLDHHPVSTNNPNTLLMAGPGAAPPEKTAGQQLQQHMEAVHRAEACAHDMQRAPILSAGVAAAAATSRDTADAPRGLVSAAVDAGVKVNSQTRPAIPRVALLFLVQGDGLLANEALWSAFLAGADYLELRQPPPAAAVRAATTVDLQALVGGPLKPPLRQHDEMAYQVDLFEGAFPISATRQFLGYTQQHLLPVQPEAEEGPPPEPQATAASPGAWPCGDVGGETECVASDEFPHQHCHQKRQQKQHQHQHQHQHQQESSGTVSGHTRGKAGQPQPQPQNLLEEESWRRKGGGGAAPPPRLASVSVQDVDGAPVGVPRWSRRSGKGLGRNWVATSSAGAGLHQIQADKGDCVEHMTASASAAMTPSNVALKVTTDRAATAPAAVTVTLVNEAVETTKRCAAEASAKAMELEEALVSASKQLTSELFPASKFGPTDAAAVCGSCDLMENSFFRPGNATAENTLTRTNHSGADALCEHASEPTARPCRMSMAASYHCRCDGANSITNASGGGERSSRNVGSSGNSSLGDSVDTRCKPVAAYSATVAWAEAEVRRLLRQALGQTLRRVKDGSGGRAQGWKGPASPTWWRWGFARPSEDINPVGEGVMVRAILLVQAAEREIRRKLALPPSLISASAASTDRRRPGASGHRRLGRWLAWPRWLLARWKQGKGEVPKLGGGVVEELNRRGLEEVWGTWSCHGVSGTRQAVQGTMWSSSGRGDGSGAVESGRLPPGNSSSSSGGGDGGKTRGRGSFPNQHLVQIQGGSGGVGWRRFFRLYVHLSDPSQRPPDGSLLSQAVLVQGTNTTRGYAQHVLVQAELLLIAAALRDPLTARLVLLSETSIPIRPAPHMWVQLMWEPRSRVDACRDINMDLGRWHDSMTTEHLHRDHWRKSSQWFTLTRQHAELVAADRHVAETFRRFCYTRRGSLPTGAGGMGTGTSTHPIMDASSATDSSRTSYIDPTQSGLRIGAATPRPNRRYRDDKSDSDRRAVLPEMHEAAADPGERQGMDAAAGPEGPVLTKTGIIISSSSVQNSTSPYSGESGKRTSCRDGRGKCNGDGVDPGSAGGRAGPPQSGGSTDPWILHRALTAGSQPCVSDEHYLPTLLASYGLEHQTDCLGEAHFVDWTGGGGWHPRSFLPSYIGELQWEPGAGGDRGAITRRGADRPLGEALRQWLAAGVSLFHDPTGPLGMATRPARLPDGRRLWGPDAGCWILPSGSGGGSQTSRYGASASLESLSDIFVTHASGTQSPVATAEPDPTPAGTDEVKGKGQGVGGRIGVRERTGAPVDDGTMDATTEAPTLRSWLENLHYTPLGYRCHLFARKFPLVSARSSLQLALACPPRGLGLGAWCRRDHRSHPPPPS